jgi:hypothetical protein
MVPSRPELEAYRRDGIAVGYRGILFKPDLEKCKAFRNNARELLHHGIDERDVILADIGANIIGSKKELMDHYRKAGKPQLYTVASKNL